MVVVWDHDGKIHREYFETKKAATEAAEGARNDIGEWKAVVSPMGPFRLVLASHHRPAHARTPEGK